MDHGWDVSIQRYILYIIFIASAWVLGGPGAGGC